MNEPDDPCAWLVDLVRDNPDPQAATWRETARCIAALDWPGAKKALGYVRKAGERSPATETALRERPRIVALMALAFNLTPRQIAERLSRYAASGWPRDRDCETCPERHEGKFEALAWRYLKVSDSLSERTIARDLAACHERGGFVAADMGDDGDDADP